MRSTCWHLYYGPWWMIQFQWDRWISVGLHVDFRRRIRSLDGKAYGPYVDLHLLCIIISLGWNPAYSGELDLKASVGRGGL